MAHHRKVQVWRSAAHQVAEDGGCFRDNELAGVTKVVLCRQVMCMHAQGSCLRHQDRRQGRNLQKHSVLTENAVHATKQAFCGQLETLRWSKGPRHKARELQQDACAKTLCRKVHTCSLSLCMTGGQAPTFRQMVEGSMLSMYSNTWSPALIRHVSSGACITLLAVSACLQLLISPGERI